jgi:hypothetical protein
MKTIIPYRTYVLPPREQRACEKYSLHFDHEVPRTLIEDLPVFDRGKMVRPGASPCPHQALGSPASKRRPGTPLPPEMTGDPHPDRVARAEALRQALLERDNRYRIEGSEDRVDSSPVPRGQRSQTPDIPLPRSYYVDIPAAEAFIEGRRGEDVLYFMTISDAARCMTGESRDAWRTAVKNAADGATKGAFGWTWLRLRSRRGKNR